MAIFRDIKFNTGTCNDRLGAVGTVTGSTFSQKEKGLAIETGASKYIQYDKQLLPNGAFSVVVWAKIKNSNVQGTDLPIALSDGINSITNVGIALNYIFGSTEPRFFLGSSNFVRFNSLTPDKNWHCWIFTCIGNGQNDVLSSKLYYDGIAQNIGGSSVASVQSARTSCVYVGGSNNVTGGNHLSRLKVYDHVLSLQEINAEQVEFNNAQPINKPKKGFVLNKPTDLSEYKGSGAGQGLIAAYNFIKV